MQHIKEFTFLSMSSLPGSIPLNDLNKHETSKQSSDYNPVHLNIS